MKNHRKSDLSGIEIIGGPSGVRTRAAALKGLCPRPLDDGTAFYFTMVSREGLEPSTTGLKVRCSTG